MAHIEFLALVTALVLIEEVLFRLTEFWQGDEANERGSGGSASRGQGYGHCMHVGGH